MQKPKRIKQIAALSAFVLLLIVFVAYRSGAFDTFFTNIETDNAAVVLTDNSPEGYEPILIDSPPTIQLPDTLRQIMYSSKSGAIIQRKPDKNTRKKDSIKKRDEFMLGSKSAPIFLSPDTTKKTKPDTARPKAIMGSSKFGAVIKPVWHDTKGNIVLPIWNSSAPKVTVTSQK